MLIINVGLVTLTITVGAAAAGATCELRFAPHRLQYLSSMVYSVPQDGQNIMVDSNGGIGNRKLQPVLLFGNTNQLASWFNPIS